jgi:subtilase-type serine protease
MHALPAWMAISAFACAGAPAAYAANFSCQSTGGSWTTAGDWTGCNGTFPDNGGGNTYDATVTSGSSTLTSAVTVGNVTIDSGASWFTSASGSTITLNNALSNRGTTLIDASGGQGGTTFSIGSDLTNSGTFDIGVTNLSAPTNVTVGGHSTTPAVSSICKAMRRAGRPTRRR